MRSIFANNRQEAEQQLRANEFIAYEHYDIAGVHVMDDEDYMNKEERLQHRKEKRKQKRKTQWEVYND